jgi:hypothetical protein
MQITSSNTLENAGTPASTSLMPKLVFSPRRAHPEGSYEVVKEAPQLAFLRRKRARGELNEAQARQLAKLSRPSVSVRFDEAGKVFIDEAGKACTPPRSGDQQQVPARLPRSSSPVLCGDVYSSGASTGECSSVPSLRDYSASSTSEPEDLASLKKRVKSLGRVTCCKADGRDAPRKVPLLDMRRPSIWSNPFDMQKRESMRERVCDAFAAWHRRGDVSVDTICSEYQVARAQAWKGDEIAATPAREAGVQQLAGIIGSGHNLAFGCACPPTKRCHTWRWRAVVLAEAEVRARKPTPSTAASAADLEAGVNEYLILFSGDRKLATRMAAQLRSIDPSAIVHERDVVNDAVAEDLLRSEVQEEIISGLYSSRYKAVYVAVPCSSYSIVRGDQIRSKAEPRGMRAAMARWGAYLAKHNQLADFAAFVLEICVELGVPWMVENPADRSLDGPAQWREFADWGCLWDQPRFRALILDGAKLHLVPMCACGSTFQKYVHVLVSPLLEERASALFGGLRCVHPSGHADQAVGVDARGQSKAAQTATYPVGFNVLAARIMAGDSPAAPRKAGTPLATKQVAASSSGQLHVGSNRPHAADGASQQYQRADRAAPSGSLRCLEPELTSVLLNERLPEANVIRVTDPVDPPSIPLPAPGPFTTAQLIPAGVVRQVSEYGKLCGRVLQRASQGKDGWRVARQMRPEPVIFEEGEALMPVGFGYAWRRREPHLPLAPDSLWDAILPSTESHPPQVGAEHILDSAAFEQLAEAHGLTDNQLRSWVKHGFPGVGLPNVAVLAPPHVGALKEAAAFEERNSRDMGHGFCSACTPFPTIWPLVCDPCNVVVQNGKARLTIDKTMWISGKVHIPPYNLLVDLNAQAEKSGR